MNRRRLPGEKAGNFSFDVASEMNRLFANPLVRRDLDASREDED